VEPAGLWHAEVVTEYGSLIEYSGRPRRELVLDAEILGTRVVLLRALGESSFVFGEGSWNVIGDGYLDGFLDAYHDFIDVSVAGRDRRPTNVYGYSFRVDDRTFEYAKAGAFFGDVRLGVGLRHHGTWQSVATVTIPTGSEPEGFRKGVVSLGLTTTTHREFGREGRFAYEGTLGFGYTPRHGELAEWQRTTFFLTTQGGRARVAGPWHVYANLIVASPYYHDSGIQELDLMELTMDFGALFDFARGPTWFLGMTQDLLPNGPAVDVVFRLGAGW
jgi:hypothetical protein